MMISPVVNKRTPALTPKVLSMVKSRTRNSAAPHNPGTLALPPATEVPPITTTAIEVKQILVADIDRSAAKIAGEQCAVEPAKRAAQHIGREADAADRECRQARRRGCSGRWPAPSGRRSCGAAITPATDREQKRCRSPEAECRKICRLVKSAKPGGGLICRPRP